MGRSYETDGLLGKRTEHYDDDGNKTGESHERDGIFGTYVEHTDAEGNRTGESREREGFLGSYTEHTNRSGTKTGESREREGFFGSYTEHTDSSGRKTGESREREGIFGNYTEHTESDSSSGCFLTTACVRARGLPDDSRELNILRHFRDTYILSLPEGPALIEEYKKIAPAIVAGLDNAPDSSHLYEGIFLQINRAIGYIEAQRPEEALDTYRDMVAGIARRLG